MSGGGKAGLAANTGAAGFGGAVQGVLGNFWPLLNQPSQC